MPTSVTDRQSFILFINSLKNDLDTQPQKWTNLTLSDYFDAISSYTEDLQGYYNNTDQNTNADTPSWKTFADILMAASMYE